MLYKRSFSSLVQIGQAAILRSRIKKLDPVLYNNLCDIVHSADINSLNKNTFYDPFMIFCKDAQNTINRANEILIPKEKIKLK